MSYQVTSSGGINVGNMNAITINAQQIGHISSGMMSDDLSEPSSPDSSSFDASDLLSNSVHDDVTAQLAAAGVCWSILNSVPASQGWFELNEICTQFFQCYINFINFSNFVAQVAFKLPMIYTNNLFLAYKRSHWSCCSSSNCFKQEAETPTSFWNQPVKEKTATNKASTVQFMLIMKNLMIL